MSSVTATTPAEGRTLAAGIVRGSNPDNTDVNRNNVVYMVRVLTQALPVNAFHIASLLQDSFIPPNYTTDAATGEIRPFTQEEKDAQGASGGPMRIQFMGRIIKSMGDGPRFGPHAFIRNPCKLRVGTNEQRINKIIAKHTKFVSRAAYVGDWPKIGDVVQVSFTRADFDSPNLKIAYFDDIITSTDSEIANNSEPNECASLIETMNNGAAVATNAGGESGGIPITNDGTDLSSQEAVEALSGNTSSASTGAGTGGTMSPTAQYDPSTGFDPPQLADYIGAGANQVITNGAIPAELLRQPESTYSVSSTAILFLQDVVEDYNRLAQAFFNHFGHKLPIGECLRCYSGGPYCQVELKQRYTSEGRGHLAAAPGTSLHGWAVAFDMNTYDSAVEIDSGKHGFEGDIYEWMFRNAPQYNWENPKWAQDPATSESLGIPCVRPGTRACGTNKEAWHWEHVSRSSFIANVRAAPTTS